jgi:hypothetical protein
MLGIVSECFRDTIGMVRDLVEVSASSDPRPVEDGSVEISRGMSWAAGMGRPRAAATS